jgi:hypothetical protein
MSEKTSDKKLEYISAHRTFSRKGYIEGIKKICEARGVSTAKVLVELNRNRKEIEKNAARNAIMFAANEVAYNMWIK